MTRLSIVLRAVALALLWLALTAGDPASWIVGIPAIVLASALSYRLSGAQGSRIDIAGALRFGLFFVTASIRGGWDVARRALLPGVRTSPVFLEYRCSLPVGWPRALFANTVSLLPGTLTADIDDDQLTVHALSEDMRPLDGVRDSENRIASMLRPTPAKRG